MEKGVRKARSTQMQRGIEKGKRDKLFHGLKKCQDALGKVLDYIDLLTYSDKVDYGYIYKLLKVVSPFVLYRFDLFNFYGF